MSRQRVKLRDFRGYPTGTAVVALLTTAVAIFGLSVGGRSSAISALVGFSVVFCAQAVWAAIDRAHERAKKEARLDRTPSRTAGVAIRVLLHQIGMTQEQLADGVGMSLSTLKRRLLGGSFRIDELVAISNYLGVPLDDVLTPPGSRVAGAR